ncbi:unnamed protein product [Allacma fusca]|uniref:PRKR-interacting protein 1 n=1 Tax=Allacma fusca TaxID=39272 RepID=A0A8J2NM13_9HEXA|nr:unnamed protein product [Allacma fusca]
MAPRISKSTLINMEPSKGDEPKKKRKRPDLPLVAIKTTVDYQRMKLERLMAKPDKVLNIPLRPKDKSLPPPPEFVRNIMGSSAGAGSGEFHVYRHLRRKEYTRQKHIQEKARLEEMHKDYESKLDASRRLNEEKTAKKRAKRLKKKNNRMKKKKDPKTNPKEESSNSSSSSSDEADGDPTVAAVTNWDISEDIPWQFTHLFGYISILRNTPVPSSCGSGEEVQK